MIFDETTGEVGEYVITDTISHVDETVILLTIDGETLTTTAEHPFYTVSGDWVNAGDLEIGEEIVSLEDGSGTVESVAVVVDPQPMYNLTVDEAHTFFVADGQWLVHNDSRFCDLSNVESLNKIAKNPVYHPEAGNCHLCTNDIGLRLREAGYDVQIMKIQHASGLRVPKLDQLRPDGTEWTIANNG